MIKAVSGYVLKASISLCVLLELPLAAGCAFDSCLGAFGEWPCPQPEQISVRHVEGKGLGYSQGYTSLDIFLSQPLCENQIVPFTDLRGHIFNNGKYAANAGLGLRWLDECNNQVWGINCFYDYLQTSHRIYNQVAIGFEALSDTWDTRLNVYLPVGHKKTNIYAFNYGDFVTQGFLMRAREQFAMRGIDAEIGYHFCRFDYFDLYVGLGPYYYWGWNAKTKNVFNSSQKHAVGGRLRASASILKYMSVEGITTYDTRFKWTGQIAVALNIPFDFTFGNSCCGDFRNCRLEERLYEPVLRNEIIVIDRVNRVTTNPEILDPEFNP